MITEKTPPMIGAQRRDVVPGGFVTRRRPRRKLAMASIKATATKWLNVRGPEIRGNFYFD